MSHRSNRRVAFTTLGCKVNQADTDRWVSELLDMGYEIVDFDRPADALCGEYVYRYTRGRPEEPSDPAPGPSTESIRAGGRDRLLRVCRDG